MSAFILLVDDELHVSQILGRRLAREGYRVDTARDGVDALDQIAAERPDLVISDLQMPRLDGISLALRLAEDPALRDVPIILLTARGHRADEEALGRTNIISLMAKPFSSHEMVTVVAEVLAKHDREAA